MSKLQEIQDQIDELKRQSFEQLKQLEQQAAEIRRQEVTVALREIVEKMEALGITTADIEAITSKSRKSSTTTVKVPKAAVIKFRGPDGETWSGRGLTPRWMTALIEAGRSKDDFAV